MAVSAVAFPADVLSAGGLCSAACSAAAPAEARSVAVPLKGQRIGGFQDLPGLHHRRTWLHRRPWTLDAVQSRQPTLCTCQSQQLNPQG